MGYVPACCLSQLEATGPLGSEMLADALSPGISSESSNRCRWGKGTISFPVQLREVVMIWNFS
jgi:hypothetical protein